MEAKELRIGNLIKWISTGNIEAVKDIVTFDKRQANINRVNIQDVEPIALTEEILIKAGFEYDEGFRAWIQKEYVNNAKMKIYNYRGEFHWNPNNFQRVKLPYVHTLQNLFSILNEGEELEINL